MIVRLTDRSISKSFLRHHCVVLYTVHVFCVRTAPVRTAKPARGATMHTLQQWCDVFAAAAVADSDALKLSLLAQSPSCPRSRQFFLGPTDVQPLAICLIWCRVVQSRDVHPCDLVTSCQVSRFQRPRQDYMLQGPLNF